MNQPDLADPFLTVAEVAEMLKLNQQTVRNWIDQGSLPAFRVGRRVRIRRSDLEQVLADGYRGGTRPPPPPPADTGPSAADFWAGEAVGVAEPPPAELPPAESPPGFFFNDTETTER